MKSILLYYFGLDPHHAHDFYLTESIVILSRTDTHLLVRTPGSIVVQYSIPATTSGGEETLLSYLHINSSLNCFLQASRG